MLDIFISALNLDVKTMIAGLSVVKEGSGVVVVGQEWVHDARQEAGHRKTTYTKTTYTHGNACEWLFHLVRYNFDYTDGIMLVHDRPAVYASRYKKR